MKLRSPVLGFNHNVRHRGRTFHVQTEDSGVKSPHIFTHLFHGGTIIRTNKLDYDPNLDELQVKGLMQSQHKMILRELKKGTHDAKIVEYLGPHPEVGDGSPERAESVPPEVDVAAPLAARDDEDRTERMDLPPRMSTPAIPVVPEAVTAPTAGIPRAPAEVVIPQPRMGPPPTAPMSPITPPRPTAQAPKSSPAMPGARPPAPPTPPPPPAAMSSGVHAKAADNAKSSGMYQRGVDPAQSAVYISARKGQREEPFAKSKTGEMAAIGPGGRPITREVPKLTNDEPVSDSSVTMRAGRATTGEHAAMNQPAKPPSGPQRPVPRPGGPSTPAAFPRAPAAPQRPGQHAQSGTLPRMPAPPPRDPTPGQIPAARAAPRGITPMGAPLGNALPPSPPRPSTVTQQRNVVVARPSVVIGGGSAATTRRGQGAPQPAPAREKTQSPDGIFGQGLISERSLDEVILAYLSEDAPEE